SQRLTRDASARLQCVSARFTPGDSPEHRPRHESGAAGIIEVEKPADQFAGCVEAGDWCVLDVEDMRRGVDLQAAESEGYPASDRIGLKGRLLDRMRPIRFVDREADGALAVLDVRIEFYVAFDGGIVFPDRPHEAFGI